MNNFKIRLARNTFGYRITCKMEEWKRLKVKTRRIVRKEGSRKYVHELYLVGNFATIEEANDKIKEMKQEYKMYIGVVTDTKGKPVEINKIA